MLQTPCKHIFLYVFYVLFVLYVQNTQIFILRIKKIFTYFTIFNAFYLVELFFHSIFATSKQIEYIRFF